VNLLLLLSAAPALAGLFGNDAPARIPVPAREFRLRVEDSGGTVLEVGQGTFDGEVFVYGTVGLAQVTVPFERLARLEVLPGPDEDHALARVSTREGEVVTLTVESDTPVWGRATFGNYRIEIGQVRSLTVL
jgi:hypothetical protein